MSDCTQPADLRVSVEWCPEFDCSRRHRSEADLFLRSANWSGRAIYWLPRRIEPELEFPSFLRRLSGWNLQKQSHERNKPPLSDFELATAATTMELRLPRSTASQAMRFGGVTSYSAFTGSQITEAERKTGQKKAGENFTFSPA